MPDIATPDAFKKALLAARSVAQTDPAQGGSSGIYFAKLLERIGIAAEMKDKLIYGKAGRDVGLLVRDLRAELGVTFTSEFVPIEGLRVVGNFPKEYEFVNGYGAAVVPEAQNSRGVRCCLFSAAPRPGYASRSTDWNSSFSAPGVMICGVPVLSTFMS